MLKKIIILGSMFLMTASAAFANECQYGKLLGFDDAGEFIARAHRVASKQYNEKQARFIKNVRATQIKKTFEAISVGEAFRSVDESVIFKFEIIGNEKTAYDSLTVIYAHQGDTLVGAVFADDSSVIAATLSDGDIKICVPGILD